MLKSVYAYLFEKKERKFTTTSVDQFFGSNAPQIEQPPQVAQITDQTPVLAEVVSNTSNIDVVKAVVIVEEVATLENEKPDKKQDEKPDEKPDEELTLVVPIKSVEEFKHSITEYITVQKQKTEEIALQQERERAEMPKRVFKQWTPNDALCNEHDAAASAVGKVPNLLKKIKQHEDRIRTKQNEVEKIQNKKDLNPFDRFELVDYKKEIMGEESKIRVIEFDLECAQKYVDNPIFEEYALYLINAEEFIRDSELTGIMSVDDILTSQSIYNKVRMLLDSVKYGRKDPALMERLDRISQIFNLGEIHENSRGKNLREYKNFLVEDKTNDPLYLFDKLDEKAIEDNSTDVKLLMQPVAVPAIQEGIKAETIPEKDVV